MSAAVQYDDDHGFYACNIADYFPERPAARALYRRMRLSATGYRLPATGALAAQCQIVVEHDHVR